MKKKVTRSAGGGKMRPSAYGPGGVNSDGPSYKNIGFKLPHTYAFKSPDSMISQRMQQVMPKDYYEDINMLEAEEEEDKEETLEEFFARIIKMPLTEEEKKAIIDEDEEEEEEENVKEIGGGVAGAAVTLGLGPKGKPRPKGWQNSFNRLLGKSFGGQK